MRKNKLKNNIDLGGMCRKLMITRSREFAQDKFAHKTRHRSKRNHNYFHFTELQMTAKQMSRFV